MFLEITTKSVEETMSLAKTIAMSITSPLVIRLDGEMGAGKTTFTKGFAQGLGCTDLVSSPTFTIMNEYKGKVFTLNHFDFYRVQSADELVELGLEGYFDTSNLKGITMVEWAENAKELMPKNFLVIKIDKLSDNERKITLKQEE